MHDHHTMRNVSLTPQSTAALNRAVKTRGMGTIGLVTATVLAMSFGLAACEDPPPPPPPKPVGAKSSARLKPSAKPSASAHTAVKSPLAKCLYFPEMATPKDNPLTAEKIKLGNMLFFDQRLGQDGKFACENCHFQDKGTADALQFSAKASGDNNKRHTPALFNVGYNQAWYWEGRAVTLEKQVLAAWKGQMGAGDNTDTIAAGLSKIEGYKKAFKSAFGKDDITGADVVNAIASFVRSVRSCNAPWDKYEKGDKKAASESAARGWEIFRAKAACAACHAPPLYTDLKYHNVGVGMDKPEPDIGREKISKDPKDKGKFKTPSLRSVTLHPPYLHDGSAKTLEDAVDYMLSGGHANPTLDSANKKIVLTKEERADLIEFIKALEGEPAKFEKPTLPE
jgi:cytochrome c peroxidase